MIPHSLRRLCAVPCPGRDPGPAAVLRNSCSHALHRLAAMALALTVLSGCETYKVVDETLAGYVVGEDYTGPAEELAKQLEEATKLAEEMAKAAEEAKAAEAAAKEKIAEMEMADLKAEIEMALADLKAEKQKQDEFDALIAALEAKEEEIIAEYEAKEAEIIAKYEEEAQQPTRVNVKIYAEKDTNRNANGEASPVSVRLVALTSEHQLMGTDYFALQDDLPGALGATFVEELSEVSAEPGQFVSTGELEVPRTTQKIGVIASFADVDRAIWRDNIDVVDRGDEVALLVALDEAAVRIIREGDAPALDLAPAPVIPAVFSEARPDDPVVEAVEAREEAPALDLEPFEPDLFDADDLRPYTPSADDAPLMVEERGDGEEIILPLGTFEVLEEGEALPEPDSDIIYETAADTLVFLDGTTRMDSSIMLDPHEGEGSVNTTLLMRDPASVQGFDVRTLAPFMPVQEFWGTTPPLFAPAI